MECVKCKKDFDVIKSDEETICMAKCPYCEAEQEYADDDDQEHEVKVNNVQVRKEISLGLKVFDCLIAIAAIILGFISDGDTWYKIVACLFGIWLMFTHDKVSRITCVVFAVLSAVSVYNQMQMEELEQQMLWWGWV